MLGTEGSTPVIQGIREIVEGLERIRITPEHEPDAEPEAGSEVAGTITDPDLQKLFVLKCALVKTAREKTREARTLFNANADLPRQPKGVKEKIAAAFYADEIANVVDTLFWIEVRRTFPEITLKTEIGLASRWRVYGSNKDTTLHGNIHVIIV